jgi:hypothetical protein
MKSSFILVCLTTIIVASSAYGATFHGRVIDADSKEPIEGAVVLASWTEEQGTPTGGTSRLHDVKETLTDKNGAWVMKGPRGVRSDFLEGVYTILSMIFFSYYTKPPEFVVFKPGYCSWPNGFSIEACKVKIKPVGSYQVADGKTVELPKLTSRQDRLLLNMPELIAGKNAIPKQKEYIRLINEERRILGLKEY